MTEVSATLVARTIRRRAAAAQRGVLRLDRQVAVESEERQIAFRGEGRERLLATADLADAGEKDEEVARLDERIGERAARRGGDAQLERAFVDALVEPGGHRMEPAAARHDRRAVEESGERRRVEGGRHDDQPEIGSRLAPHLADERQGEVGGERALVEFVEDHRRDPFEEGIPLEPAQQQPLGDEDDPAVGAEAALEADPPADLPAERPPLLVGDAARRGARRHPARLQHDDLAGRQLAGERRRHPRRLAGARGRVQHGGAGRTERGEELRQDSVDREGGDRRDVGS